MRQGPKGDSISWCAALSEQLPMLSSTPALRTRAFTLIESHTGAVLPVAVVTAMEASKGSSRHESQWSLGAELACGALRDG